MAIGDDQQGIFNSLLNEGPESWRAYLRPFEDGEPPTGLSMLVIFDHIAPRAKAEQSLDWAEVAVRALDLEALGKNGAAREDAMQRVMNFRCWFIARTGSRANHKVLDKEIVLRWIREELTMQVPTARRKSEDLWENLSQAGRSGSAEGRNQAGEDLKKLRRIKNRLNAAKVLLDCGELPEEYSLRDWLEIRENLP